MTNTAFARENISYWTQRAPGYSAVNKEELNTSQREIWRDVIIEQISRNFPNRRPEEIKVLDAGTGPGFFAVILAEAGYCVTAVDYTSAMLDEARSNAGELGERISFLKMDVQELRFADASFDVVISRNVTWNLNSPESAYRHWARVLKPGGLLLNFDANWYRYLHDSAARCGHLADRRNVCETDVEDDTAGTDVDAMEAIACKAPLSVKVRPAWDVEVLQALNLHTETDEKIWRRVWTRAERINNASTPMFMIYAMKGGKID